MHDETEIERIRQKVGLPKEQAHNLIIQIMREKVLEEKKWKGKRNVIAHIAVES